MTLDAVENREVRPVFHDARVHVALNCAARSCPPLRAEAYTAAGIDAQLAAQARAYVNAAGHVEIDTAAHTVRVAQIFEWFREDFAGAGGVVEWLRAFAGTPLRAQLNAACAAGACAVTYRPYEWALNAAR